MQSRAPLLGLAKSIYNSTTKVTVILKALLKNETFSRCVSREAKLDYFEQTFINLFDTKIFEFLKNSEF